MKRRWKGLSWRAKLFVLLTAFACLPVFGLVFWVLRDFEQTQRRMTLASLEGLATAKADAIEQLTDERRNDVERIADLLSPQVVAVLEQRRASETPDPPPEELPPLEDEQLEQPPDRPEDAATEGDPAEEADAAGDAGGEAAEEEPAGGEGEDEPAPPRASPGDDALRDARDALRHSLALILWDQSKFEELLVIDGEGRVIASTFAEHEGRSAVDLQYFQNARGATFVQGVFMSPITERLTMVISTPIRDENAQGIGVLAARMNLRRLFALLGDTTGLGETGETVVTRADGEQVAFMAPTRHDPDAVMRPRMDLRGDAAEPSVEATLGRPGAGQRVDYRGREVLAAWRPVPALDWGVVVKMDEEEAMRTVSEVRMRTLQVSLVLIVLAVLASILVSRELVRPLRQLKDATDRISRGDLGVQLTIRSADEIGELADSFERMVAAIKFFREHARTAEEDPLEAEPEATAGDDQG